MAKQEKPKKHKYVAQVVLETGEKVTKKAIREWLSSRVAYIYLLDGTPHPIKGVRIRSIDLD